VQIVAHVGHQRRDTEPAKETEKKGAPAHVERAHGRGSKAKKVNALGFFHFFPVLLGCSAKQGLADG
jgi:hypothetical protein